MHGIRTGWIAVPLNRPMADWTGRRVWLLGASSGIGRATASALHALGATVIVSARSEPGLQSFIDQHAGAQAWPLDVTDLQAVHRVAAGILAQGELDCVVYCAGHFNAMDARQMVLHDMVRHNQINYLGALYLLDAVLPHFLKQSGPVRGHISLMGSVAGYRGLPQSLAYGPTKAALINLAEALYLDLHRHGVGVSLVNPGFVDTPLTAHNRFKMPALITPERAAQDILKGWAKGDFEIHFPRRFTFWMKLLRCLPYRPFFAITGRLNGTAPTL